MRTAAALLCVGLAAVSISCTPQSDAPRQAPSDLPSVEFALFAPDLDGAEPVETTVYDDLVKTTYEWDGRHAFTLTQQPAPQGNLCFAKVRQGMSRDGCTVRDGVRITEMEEMSGVALVRDDTLVAAGGLVTEADPGLRDRATEALKTAPEVSLSDLGEVSEGEEPPAPAEPPPVDPGDFDADIAMRVVRHLAGTIGPREATSPAYDRAARWVGRRFDRLGYSVRRQRIAVPAGTSWQGVPVGAGRAVNVIATPPDFLPEEPHLIVGAHLDTVAQAPGAEDNASGIGVMLAVAEAVALSQTRLPVVFVAFGAEEPRGPTDADHHYGSRAYVAAMAPGERDAVRGMVSLDRVGVGARVPVGSANDTDPVQRQLLAAATEIGCPDDARPGPAQQRPLVLRPGRVAGRAAGQHVVRRIPLGRRRDVGGRAGSASPRGASGPGLARVPLRPQPPRPAHRRSARQLGVEVRPHPPALGAGRRTRSVPVTTQPRPRGRDRPRSAGGRTVSVSTPVMSPRGVPGVVARGRRRRSRGPSRPSPWSWCAWLPTTTSAPASTRSAASERWPSVGQPSPWTPQCR